MSVNGVRGEVEAVIGLKPRKLCLTLGALAEIESGLGVVGVGALQVRLQTLSAADILLVLAALLRGGGEAVAVEGLSREPLTLKEAAEGIVAAFKASAL